MADTTNYMLLGYGLAVIIFVVIIGSIWWRYQSLAKDEALLEQLEQEAPVEKGASIDAPTKSTVRDGMSTSQVS